MRKKLPILFVEIHTRDLAKECYDSLRRIGYAISVIETGMEPDFKTEPNVCLFAARPEATKGV